VFLILGAQSWMQ